MSTVLIKVTRKWETGKSIISEFHTTGGRYGMVSGFFMEEKDLPTIKSTQGKPIPTGIYTLKWHNTSYRERRLPLLYNHQIPESSRILINNINCSGYEKGYLLTGSTKSYDWIGGSRPKLESLLTFLNCYDLDSGQFAVEIKDGFISSTLITAIRQWATEKSTISEFYTLRHRSYGMVSGFFLEEKGPSTIKSGQDRRIPAGVYSMKWHNSPRFGRKLPLLYNDQVPESRYILIHSGNHAGHTEGCLLTGSTRSDNQVGNSREKLNSLLEFLSFYDLDSEKYFLEIKENYFD